MRRLSLLLLLLLIPALSGAEETRLEDRSWRFGISGVTTWSDQFDVFAHPQLPPGPVDEKGHGGGFCFGRRFGQRFLLDLQVTFSNHDLPDDPAEMIGAWGLFTGTVLFRTDHTLQPFLRGGLGGGSLTLDFAEDGGYLMSFGTAALTGAGVMVRLSSRFSLELEAAAIFTNHLEVDNEDGWADEPRRSWKVRESSQAWRMGLGLSVWF